MGEVAPAAGGAAGFLVIERSTPRRFRADAGRGLTADSFVFVKTYSAPRSAPLRPDAVGSCSRRPRAGPGWTPRSGHTSCGTPALNVADAGGGIDVVADLLGHASVSSSQVYVHPDASRLRAAVDAVPSPRERAGVAR